MYRFNAPPKSKTLPTPVQNDGRAYRIGVRSALRLLNEKASVQWLTLQEWEGSRRVGCQPTDVLRPRHRGLRARRGGGEGAGGLAPAQGGFDGVAECQ